MQPHYSAAAPHYFHINNVDYYKSDKIICKCIRYYLFSFLYDILHLYYKCQFFPIIVSLSLSQTIDCHDAWVREHNTSDWKILHWEKKRFMSIKLCLFRRQLYFIVVIKKKKIIKAAICTHTYKVFIINIIISTTKIICLAIILFLGDSSYKHQTKISDVKALWLKSNDTDINNEHWDPNCRYRSLTFIIWHTIKYKYK